MNEEIIGYMCKVDWEDERFNPMSGNKIYAELEDLKEDHDCWKGCGIVEVAVRLVRVIEKGHME